MRILRGNPPFERMRLCKETASPDERKKAWNHERIIKGMLDLVAAGEKIESAAKAIAKKYNVSPSTVRNAWADHRGFPVVEMAMFLGRKRRKGQKLSRSDTAMLARFWEDVSSFSEYMLEEGYFV
jgi:DNA-binding GntR family transcriptional regulator